MFTHTVRINSMSSSNKKVAHIWTTNNSSKNTSNNSSEWKSYDGVTGYRVITNKPQEFTNVKKENEVLVEDNSKLLNSLWEKITLKNIILSFSILYLSLIIFKKINKGEQKNV